MAKAALDDEQAEGNMPEGSEGKDAGDKAATDAKMVISMAVKALIGNPEGVQQIVGLLKQAKDLAGVMAHVVASVVSKVREKMVTRGIKLDDRIWVARGGVVDHLVKELAQIAVGVAGIQQAADPKLMEEARNQTLALLQQEESQGAQGAPVDDSSAGMPAGQGSPGPQGGPPQGTPPVMGGM